MRYAKHLEAMDVRLRSDLHGRDWRLTGRQYAVAVRIAGVTDWMRVTQRGGARSSGYSLHGFHRLISSLRAGGFVAVRTLRGRNGGTWIRARRSLLSALHRGNVPERGFRPESRDSERLGLGGNISGLEAWRKLGTLLRRDTAASLR